MARPAQRHGVAAPKRQNQRQAAVRESWGALPECPRRIHPAAARKNGESWDGRGRRAVGRRPSAAPGCSGGPGRPAASPVSAAASARPLKADARPSLDSSLTPTSGLSPAMPRLPLTCAGLFRPQSPASLLPWGAKLKVLCGPCLSPQVPAAGLSPLSLCVTGISLRSHLPAFLTGRPPPGSLPPCPPSLLPQHRVLPPAMRQPPSPLIYCRKCLSAVHTRSFPRAGSVREEEAHNTRGVKIWADE